MHVSISVVLEDIAYLEYISLFTCNRRVYIPQPQEEYNVQVSRFDPECLESANESVVSALSRAIQLSDLLDTISRIEYFRCLVDID